MAKTASIPSIWVEPEFRQDIESVLGKNETLSSFIEDTIRSQVEYRKAELAFTERAMASRNKAKETGVYYTHEEVMGELSEMLETAKRAKK